MAGGRMLSLLDMMKEAGVSDLRCAWRRTSREPAEPCACGTCLILLTRRSRCFVIRLV
jgi:hypothetical protein